jgi:hypothetical protein
MRLSDIFNRKNTKRDKVLSRVLGIFSEEIASLWFKSDCSPYITCGRPTVYRRNGEAKGYTLDFTLKEKSGKEEIFIAEMKCEMEYENYKYLELKEYSQLHHHKGEAFQRFLSVASNPEEYKVTVAGTPIKARGSILIWGAVTEEGKKNIIHKAHLHDILSLEDMVNDLLQNKTENGFQALLDQYKEWTSYLFEKLGTRT